MHCFALNPQIGSIGSFEMAVILQGWVMLKYASWLLIFAISMISDEPTQSNRVGNFAVSFLGSLLSMDHCLLTSRLGGLSGYPIYLVLLKISLFIPPETGGIYFFARLSVHISHVYSTGQNLSIGPKMFDLRPIFRKIKPCHNDISSPLWQDLSIGMKFFVILTHWSVFRKQSLLSIFLASVT